MMNHLEDDNSEMESKLECLNYEITEMREFFDKLAIPIIKRAVRKVEKQLRGFPREASQFGDDYKLNFFEEVCVMLQEDSIDDYPFVRSTIESCCEGVYDDLSYDDKFILNHQTYSYEDNGVALIIYDFLSYANEYENKKITDTFYSRN